MNRMREGLLTYLKEEELKRIESITVGVAGCGGLGSNTAHALVRLGFKNFHLVDFDRVAPSNLNRQFFFYDQLGEIKCEALRSNLLRINPNLNIKTSCLRVERDSVKELFKKSSIVVEAFDKSDCKKMIIEELSGFKKVVAASGLGSYWMTDSIKTMELGESLTVVGDFKSDVESGVSPLSPGVYTASAKQAGAVLKMVLKDFKC